MCFGEILWRIRKLIWQIWAKIRYKQHNKYCQGHIQPSTHIVEMISKIKFYGMNDVNISDIPNNWIQNSVEQADKLLEHKFEYFGFGEILLGKKVNFNHEYKRGIDTPLKFGPWIDYRDTDSYGDFKYFWEVPRLQHLTILAKAFYLTKNQRYANEVEEQLKSFLEQSPYLSGVNWIMPMEAGIRLVSICWITAFLKDYLHMNPKLCGVIEKLIISHVEYISKNYSAYSSANNHLVGEAAGVFIASICFGDLKGMEKHRNNAYEMLSREVLHQHHEDGVNKEQAIHYQMFCFDFFLLAGLLGQHNGLDFTDEYWTTLEKSAEFIACMNNDAGQWIHIGDSDDGKAVALTSNIDETRSMLATSAVLFDRADFKAIAKKVDEKTFWLLGEKGKNKFEQLTIHSPRKPFRSEFPHGGYYVLHSIEPVNVKLIFDCGPLGFESIAAHGHADSLSFILMVHGREFFIDTGTYTYVAEDPYRNYFRSTAAHNTIVIDGVDQSEMQGPFLWSKKANSFLEEFTSNDSFDNVSGWHDGYTRLANPVIHRRSIELDKKEALLSINDTIECDASHRFEQFFHLSEKCSIKRINERICQITNDGKTIKLKADKRTSITIAEGNEKPIMGWRSHAYDQKTAVKTIICRAEIDGNTTLTTTISLKE